MRAKYWAGIAAIMGLVAVIVGAFASHSLQEQLSPKALAWLETAVRYQMYHALALLALACLTYRGVRSNAEMLTGLAFTTGVLCFSGSLYYLAFTGITHFAFVIPIGGALLIIGWLSLFFVAMGLDPISDK